MRRFMFALWVMGVVSACGPAGDEVVSTTQALGSPTLTTSSSTYSTGQPINVSWANLPGNAMDWIAIAPSGSAATTVSRWTYTGGAVDGSYAFSGIGNGTFVARAFANDTYELLVESAPFTVGSSTTVTTDQTAYTLPHPVTVTWSGAPGNALDWVSIAPAGSSEQTITSWAYTGGATSGTHTFNAPTAGSYEARVYLDDGYTILAQSAPFSVASAANATLLTDKPAYTFDDAAITISWSGMPGSPTDWLATAVPGSPSTSILRWKYTGGGTSGTSTLETPAAYGDYVIRAFANDTYTQVGESVSFRVQVRVTPNATTYVTEQAIDVTWGALAPNTYVGDYSLGLVAAGSPASQTPLATASLDGIHPKFPVGPSTPGSYVIRMYHTSGTTRSVWGESTPFTVTAGGPTVTTDSQVQVNRYVGIKYTNFPSSPNNWIGIAPQGAPNTTVLHWSYVSGSSGMILLQAPATPGTYVARGFANDSYSLLVESAPFTVY